MHCFFQKSDGVFRSSSLLILVPLGIIISTLRGDCFLFDDSDQLSLPNPGRASDFSRTKNLTISAGADSNLFESPKKFPRVQNVAIGSRTNSKYLKDLSLNYTYLKELGIIQIKPLDIQDIETLKKFDSLKGLSLDCPVESVDELEKCLPSSLEELLIGPNCDITSSSTGLNLNHLRTLQLIGVEVSAKFIKELHCPELHTLALINASIEKNSFDNFGPLPRLKKITVSRSRLSAKDIASIAEAKIHLVGNPYQKFKRKFLPCRPPTFTNFRQTVVQLILLNIKNAHRMVRPFGWG